MTDSGNVSVVGNVTLNDVAQAGITLDMLQADASVILTSAGNTALINDSGLNLEGAVTGTLAAIATTGNITDSNILTVSGTTTATTSAANGTIDFGTLASTGAVSLNTNGSRRVMQRSINATALDLAASTIGGTLECDGNDGWYYR